MFVGVHVCVGGCGCIYHCLMEFRKGTANVHRCVLLLPEDNHFLEISFPSPTSLPHSEVGEGVKISLISEIGFM